MSDFKTIEDIRREEIRKSILITVEQAMDLTNRTKSDFLRWAKAVGLKKYAFSHKVVRYSLVEINEKNEQSAIAS